MSQILRQSTQVVVRIGPFVDVTDGFTPETGITLGAADEAEALRAAGAATLDISGATWAAVTGCRGWYDLTLSTTATNTVGTLDIVVQDDSVCLPVFARFLVIEEAIYDGLYAASAAALPAVAAGAAGGLWILGANAAATTTLTGVAAAGATPATQALALIGGAASTTGGGVSAEGLKVLGGAGAASTNGAAIGLTATGGGTNTVASNAHGVSFSGASTGAGLNAGSGAGATGNGITATALSTNGSGMTLVKTGTGSDLNATVTPLVLAKTTNLTGLNDIAATAVVSAGAITTSAGKVSGVILTDTLTTYTGNTVQTGDSFARIGAAGAGLTAIDLPDQTMNITGNITGNLSGSVGSVTGAVGSVTGAVGSVTARVTANTDQFNGVADGAARIARSTQGIVLGTVDAASTTTSIVTSSLDPAAAVTDQFKGRIVTFQQGTTTANLRGQSTDITASTAAGVLTVTALSTAPVSGDVFVVS
jgi:hypothetical protein